VPAAFVGAGGGGGAGARAPGAAPPAAPAAMSYILGTDKIAKQLHAQAEACGALQERLEVAERLLETKQDKSSLEELLRDAASTTRQTLDRAVADMQERLSAVLDRVGALEQRERQTGSALALKADTRAVEIQGADLQARLGAMAEEQHRHLTSALAERVPRSVVDEQQQQLGALQLRLAPLEQLLCDLPAQMLAKVDAAQYEQARQQTDRAVETLERRCAHFDAACALKADTDGAVSGLQQRIGGLQTRLDSQVVKLEQDLGELNQVVKHEPSSLSPKKMEDQLGAVSARAVALELDLAAQRQQHEDALTAAALSTKLALQQLNDQLCEKLASKKVVAANFEQQQKKAAASIAEAREHHTQLSAKLDTKVDASCFRKCCEEASESRAAIVSHERQLATCIGQKDQIIAMCDRMQEDLRLALAFKGRGQRREPSGSPMLRPGSPLDSPANRNRLVNIQIDAVRSCSKSPRFYS